MILRDRPFDAAPDSGGGGTPAAPAPDPRDAELARMRAALANPAPPVAAPAPDRKALETAFWQDPLGMSAAIATAAGQNNPANETLMEVAMQQARGTDPEMQAIWDKYLPEIQQHVSTVQPQFRTNVVVWRNAFNFVKGQHVDDIIKTREAARGPAIHTPDGPAAPGVRAPAAPAKSKLTEEESFICSNLGLTEDQYRHGKEIMANQHGREKSPWDEAITVDSSVKRRQDANRRNAAA